MVEFVGGSTVGDDAVGRNPVGIGDNGQLRAFFERIECLKGEQKALSQDVASIYAEAKSQGFDAKAMREVVKLRGMDRDKRINHEALVDLYRSAVGLS